MRKAFAAAAALVLAAGLAACAYWSKPSDAEMLEIFRANRQQIESLVGMIHSDKVLRRVDEDWTDPLDPATQGIAPERIAEYRRRLGDIGMPRGFIYSPETGEVRFFVWTAGVVGAGAGKSIVFSPKAPNPVVDNLDTYRPPDGAHDVWAYRHIDGAWYLQYDSD